MSRKIEKKEDVHISLLKEVMEICGYHKSELEDISFDEISLTDDGYILLKDERLDVEYAFSLEEYIKYSDWWTAIERDKKIDEIFKD
jgi:hypothetical protein